MIFINKISTYLAWKNCLQLALKPVTDKSRGEVKGVCLPPPLFLDQMQEALSRGMLLKAVNRQQQNENCL